MSKFQDRHPLEVAEEQGLLMVTPERFELFIDIDEETEERQRAMLAKGILTLRKNGSTVETIKETISKSGKGWHVYLRAEVPGWDSEDPIVRSALQAMIGSDPVKEILSLFRVWKHADRPPCTFFETVGESSLAFDGDDIPW